MTSTEAIASQPKLMPWHFPGRAEDLKIREDRDFRDWVKQENDWLKKIGEDCDEVEPQGD